MLHGHLGAENNKNILKETIKIFFIKIIKLISINQLAKFHYFPITSN